MVARDSGEVVPQIGLTVGRDQVCALFGAEDDVEDGTDVAVRHVVSPPKGGSNYFLAVSFTQRFRAGLISFVPRGGTHSLHRNPENQAGSVMDITRPRLRTPSGLRANRRSLDSSLPSSVGMTIKKQVPFDKLRAGSRLASLARDDSAREIVLGRDDNAGSG